MRRSLGWIAVSAVVLCGGVALAQEGGESSAPVTVAEGGESTSSGGEGGGALRASGALLDKSDTTHRKMMLSFFGELHWPYYYGFFGPGVGVRFAIPIVKAGFVPQINDSFWIEFGASTGFHFNFGAFSFGLTIPAQVMYMVHLIKNFAVYAKLSIGIHFELFTYSYLGSAFWAYFHGAGGVGLVYNLSDSFALRAEIMSNGFNGGIAFQF